jgi:hypothetical protein
MRTEMNGWETLGRAYSRLTVGNGATILKPDCIRSAQGYFGS